ncbi:hypothetical protein RJ641_022716 [Dillenia turbinata]|uniref:Uncharacterized protein n=1 Tax=Dillenia turbinata TaxID=194707 RepID=A0AAN8UD21_9MAGN
MVVHQAVHFLLFTTLGTQIQTPEQDLLQFIKSLLPMARRSSGSLLEDCDGRLIHDFLLNFGMFYVAETLSLPYQNAYLDTIATAYELGSNFAFGCAQLLLFKQSDSRTKELFKNLSTLGVNPFSVGGLPQLGDFTKALCTLHIGLSDVLYGFMSNMTVDQIRATIPKIVNLFPQAVQGFKPHPDHSHKHHHSGLSTVLDLNLCLGLPPGPPSVPPCSATPGYANPNQNFGNHS